MSKTSAQAYKTSDCKRWRDYTLDKFLWDWTLSVLMFGTTNNITNMDFLLLDIYIHCVTAFFQAIYCWQTWTIWWGPSWLLPSPWSQKTWVGSGMSLRLNVKSLILLSFILICNVSCSGHSSWIGAPKLLVLPFAARRLYTADGKEVCSLSELQRNDLVYVTCGEPWSDPQLSYSEQQRRAVLANLAADISHIRQFCVLRDPSGNVYCWNSSSWVA